MWQTDIISFGGARVRGMDEVIIANGYANVVHSFVKVRTMATYNFRLSTPPSDPRKRELWLQHAAGFILFQDMRDYAVQQIDQSIPDESRAAAQKGIDDAVYGLMMILDGVTGALTNDSQRVNLRVAVELIDCNNDESIFELDLMDGDGMCMGYHGWLENEFGETPPFVAEQD